MKNTENVWSARIVTGALAIGFLLLVYTIHREYATEISEEVKETVVKYLPDMENSLAKL